MKSKSLFIALIFFLLVGGILAFSSDKVVGVVQIEPSPTQRPYCFTGWGLQKLIEYGEKSEDCTWKADQYNTHLPQITFEGKVYPLEYVSVFTTSPCKWNDYVRQNIYCPTLDRRVSLSVDKDRIPENGKFNISWSSIGGVEEELTPGTKCILSGKAPESGNFSEETKDGSRTYDFVQRGIYYFKFSCEGILDNVKSTARGTISKSVTVFVGDIPPAPTVTLKAEPVVIKKGESATLSWGSENVVALSINKGIGVVPRSGSIKVSPGLTTTYAITGSGEFAELGLARKSVTVRVIAPEAPPEALPIEAPPDVAPPPQPPPEEKPKVDLKVNGKDGPITVSAPANLTLSWNLDKYCLANGSWLGIKTKAGSENRTEKKSGTYTYKLYCPTVGSDEVTVRVVGGTGPAAALPVAEASASLDGKNFARSIRVVRGEKTKIFLSASQDISGDKLVSRDETGKWTNLMINGGQCLWNFDLNQGVPTFDVAIPNPEEPEDCAIELPNLTFFDKPGVYQYGVLRLAQKDGKLSNIGHINIAVQEAPLPDGPPVIDFRINNLEGPTVTLGAPADYLLTWNVRNADSCSASDNWGGEKFPVGSQHFVSSEKKEFNYTLTCIGKLGTTKKSIHLKVSELPVCDFSALPLTLSKSVFDRQSVLSWKCQFANSCEISPSVGSVQTFGSARVSPKNTTTYTLTCQNLEGISSFDQAVEVR